MTNIIIANIIAFIASILMAYTGILKKKSTIIFVQTVQIALFVLSNLMLGGITGAIVNAISCVRNILCYKDKLGKLSKTVIVISTITLSLMFNNLGIIGLLPIIATVLYTLFMDVKDIIKFKYLSSFISLLWGIYDIFIISYSSAFFDFLTIITTIVSIIKIKSSNKVAVIK